MSITRYSSMPITSFLIIRSMIFLLSTLFNTLPDPKYFYLRFLLSIQYWSNSNMVFFIYCGSNIWAYSFSLKYTFNIHQNSVGLYANHCLHNTAFLILADQISEITSNRTNTYFVPCLFGFIKMLCIVWHL